MTETAALQDIQPQGLWNRIVGVVTSPKATFENVVAAPRPVGILLIVALVIGISSAVPQFSVEGQQAVIKMQVDAAARSGSPMSDERKAGLERFAPYFPYFTIGWVVLFMPLISLFLAALFWAIFNVVLGGTAMFKQVLAIVTHSHVITALGTLVSLPFLLSDPTSIMGPFNLGALAPMLEEGSRLARFLTNVSVFSLWFAVVLAIGLAVLYRRKTGGILVSVLAVILGFAYIGSMFGG